jgi:hypothetical protein
MPPDGAERRSDQPADRVGGKDAAHTEILLAGPALEGVEGDPDPDPTGPEAHQETGGEVDRERVAEHEAERRDGDQDEGADEQGPGTAATDDRAGECEPTIMPVGNEATSSPMAAGPAPVASAIAGATGTITL